MGARCRTALNIKEEEIFYKKSIYIIRTWSSSGTTMPHKLYELLSVFQVLRHLHPRNVRSCSPRFIPKNTRNIIFFNFCEMFSMKLAK